MASAPVPNTLFVWRAADASPNGRKRRRRWAVRLSRAQWSTLRAAPPLGVAFSPNEQTFKVSPHKASEPHGDCVTCSKPSLQGFSSERKESRADDQKSFRENRNSERLI